MSEEINAPSIAEIIRTTAKNQSEFFLTIANHIEKLEEENANLKLELKKWSVSLEPENNKQ